MEKQGTETVSRRRSRNRQPPDSLEVKAEALNSGNFSVHETVTISNCSAQEAHQFKLIAGKRLHDDQRSSAECSSTSSGSNIVRHSKDYDANPYQESQSRRCSLMLNERSTKLREIGKRYHLSSGSDEEFVFSDELTAGHLVSESHVTCSSSKDARDDDNAKQYSENGHEAVTSCLLNACNNDVSSEREESVFLDHSGADSLNGSSRNSKQNSDTDEAGHKQEEFGNNEDLDELGKTEDCTIAKHNTRVPAMQQYRICFEVRIKTKAFLKISSSH